MTPYYEEAGITIYQGDALAVLPELETCSVDACLTDPPYGLGFMGKEWDHGVPGRETWEAVLRVLKPGAPLLAFGGTRTHHRLMCAIEDAGFEIRDCLMWLYGCLSEDTEILIDGLWEPYHKATAGSIALCYDVRDGEFSRQPVQELVTYDYDDTAYRIESDSTDQIVSRNHRCIIERSGAEVFELAEVAARESEVRVPVLEDLRGLLVSLSMPDTRTGEPQPDVLERVLIGTVVGTTGVQTDDLTANEAGYMCGVRYEGLEAASVAEEDQRSDVLQTLRGSHAGAGVSQALVQGTGSMDSRSGAVLLAEDDRPEQPSVEGRGDVLPQARELRSDQIRSMPTGVSLDGPQGWLRDGTPDSRSEGNGPSSPTNGSGSPRQSRSNRQSAGVDAVSEQPRAQTIRAPRYTRSDLARISPFHYRGVMWCVRVPTGAFVARRNGKIFITGNSGFPKSLDISKAIDKAAGAERTVLSRREQPDIRGGSFQNRQRNGVVGNVEVLDTAPSTDAAKLWSGYGTALKPAYEIIISAQKPYDLRGLCAIMVQRIAKSLCQLAKGAGLSSTSSRAVLEPLDSALWPAARACSSPGDLFDLMDTLPFGSEIPSSLNTGLSWLESLGVILKHGSTFTTEMGSSLTTDLRILNSLSFPNTPGDIIEAAMNPLGTGSSAVIQTAVSIFNGVRAKLKHTLTPSVRGPATFTDGLSGLRPNWEPIILAMKPCEGTFADNALRHGVAGLNIEAGRIGTEPITINGNGNVWTSAGRAGTQREPTQRFGRWPANLLLGCACEGEHGPDCPVRMLDEQSGQSTTPSKVTRGKRQMAFGMGEQRDVPCYGDSGGASRFFYCAKASKSERNAGLEGMPQSNNMRVNAPCKDEAEKHATQHGNTHPTVKPLKLCEYLARMILPPERDTQRRLLVPFSGSGSEMLGALRAGWDEVVGIEMNADYCEIAWRRIGAPPPLIGSEDPPRPATDEQMALLGWQDALKEEAISGGGK